MARLRVLTVGPVLSTRMASIINAFQPNTTSALKSRCAKSMQVRMTSRGNNGRLIEVQSVRTVSLNNG